MLEKKLLAVLVRLGVLIKNMKSVFILVLGINAVSGKAAAQSV